MVQPLIPSAFQRSIDGRTAKLFRLQGQSGLEVDVSNYGARVLRIAVPDARAPSQPVDVALHYASLQGYIDGQQSMGAMVGRWAGRLRNARIQWPDGRVRQLPSNSGAHQIHGGPRGLRHQVLSVTALTENSITLHHRFTEADDGVPGSIELQLRITLTDDNALHLTWTARAMECPTVLNLTGHTFFNLAGAGSTHQHTLHVPAGRFVPLAADLCPEGGLADVAGTPLDFRRPKPLGDALAQGGTQLARAGGLDHFLVLDGDARRLGTAAKPQPLPDTPADLRWAATLADPASGRAMDVWCTAPGLQVYAGQGLQGDPVRDRGRAADGGDWLWQPGDGICLEPMEFPDAPNQALFPLRWLKPNETVHGAIVYRFRQLGM